MRVLCDAVPFGFGPIGKLLTIRAHLPADWEFTLLASGTTLDLASLSGFARIEVCDTENENDLYAHRDTFARHDMLLNVMSPVSLSFAASLGIPIAEIDSLFWMWDSAPESWMQIRRYYIQNFPGVDESLARFAPQNALVVGPIVDMRHRTKSGSQNRNQMLIHLGGLESKLVSGGSSYLDVIGLVLAQALVSHPFERVIVAGNPRILQDTPLGWHVPCIEVRSLSHDAFLVELNRSRLVLLSPGLTTTYEAFSYGVPALFLLPQNFSQYHILLKLRQHALAPLVLHWLDLYPDIPCTLDMPESKGVRAVSECISRFLSDRIAQNQVIRALQAALRDLDFDGLRRTQTQFISTMGSDGVTVLAHDIVQQFSGQSL